MWKFVDEVGCMPHDEEKEKNKHEKQGNGIKDSRDAGRIMRNVM